jgi:hypothetical protein
MDMCALQHHQGERRGTLAAITGCNRMVDRCWRLTTPAEYALPVDDEFAVAGRHRTVSSGVVSGAALWCTRPHCR